MHRKHKERHEGRPHHDDFGAHGHEMGPSRRGGHGHRHGGPGTGRGRRGRGPGFGRAGRGDVRTAVLLLLAEEPMHGYQLMQSIGERTGGRWTPSPGAVYPTISQLEDEGLVSLTRDGGRKLVALTQAGQEHVAASRDSWPDPFVGEGDADQGPDLRAAVMELRGAVREVARVGTAEQRTAAAESLKNTRRDLYLLLANDPDPT